MQPAVVVTFRDAQKVRPYAEALRLVGVEPVLVSPEAPATLNGWRGLLITGGTDVNPARYGASPHPETQAPDDERDALESRFVEEALARDVPVLAICRGMQLLNVFHHGTLVQHLPSHSVRTPDPSVPIHDVVVQPDTLLARVLGAGVHPVNSRHHQVIAEVGQGLRVAARSAADGVIEALERPDRRFVLAVQWHPEDQVTAHPAQKRLFASFAGSLK